ncbi:energy transducer TonB [Coprobacter secundus]|uniref:energy transducer TonB n=1 Tax=Coprobacter secundus TaxID=1501392 RepID=UPI0022E80D4A|nr:energy transducer TonB [Coprobacter secundus]
MGLLSYIRGDRKGKAAHELERKAMQDPFLSEALDGYDDADVQDTDKRLLRLQERVSRRTRKRRVPIYGAVAAVLLLSLSVSIYLFTRYELPDEELAVLAESRTVDTLSIMMPAGNMEQIGKQESPVVADAEPVRSKKSQKKEMVAAERELQTVSDMANGLEESIVTVDEKRNIYSSRRKIASLSSIRKDTVLVQASATARNQSMALAAAPKLPEPVPVMGYEKYYDYLYKSVVVPVDSVGVPVKGTVILKFKIDEKGRPGDFVVVESLSPGLAQEVMRVLKAGPDWNPAGEVSSFVVKF